MSFNETPQLNEKAVQAPMQILRLLINPHSSVQEIGERRRAQLLAVITLILTIGYVVALLFTPKSPSEFIVLLLFSAVAYGLSRTPYYSLGSYFFCFSSSAFGYWTLFTGTASNYTAAVTTSVHVSLIFASILLPLEGLILLILFVAGASATAPYYSHVPITVGVDFFRDTGVIVIMGVILIGASLFRSFIERARFKQWDQVNKKLESVTATLEQRVEERTIALENAKDQISRRAAQLQAVTKLSESIAQVQDLNEIFPATTKLISERFGFYHVGIFLVDQNHEYAILQAANSDGGQRMLKRSHRLQLGVGVVGFCAETGQPRIALDVGTDAVFFNNPDLPQTRSEVALPMKSRGETIGVLDVQSTEPSAFSNEDLEVLTTLANQVSIALQNARLLTEARAAYTQMQEVYNEFTRVEWGRTVSQTQQPGFRYQTGRIEMLEQALQGPEVTAAVQHAATVASRSNSSSEKHAAVIVPVKLRGEVIGILQIESHDPQKEWREDEVSLVQAVAERAAFAMENARLFQDARRRAAKERLISEATSRISTAFNVENILQTTAQELERVLGGSEILIQFQSKEQS